MGANVLPSDSADVSGVSLVPRELDAFQLLPLLVPPEGSEELLLAVVLDGFSSCGWCCSSSSQNSCGEPGGSLGGRDIESCRKRLDLRLLELRAESLLLLPLVGRPPKLLRASRTGPLLLLIDRWADC